MAQFGYHAPLIKSYRVFFTDTGLAMPVNTILVFCQVPIKPLQKHIVKVHVCCEQLIPFFDAVAEDRWEDAEKIRQQIAQLEKKRTSSSAKSA